MLVSMTNSDKTSFGWHGITHKKISSKIINEYKYRLPGGVKKRFNARFIRDNCTLADREIAVRSHFADINNLSTSPKDAFCLAQEYTKKAIESHRNGDYRDRDMQIAYALHFIQDSVDPVHVVFNKLARDTPEIRFHIAFENIARTLEKRVVNHISLKNSEGTNFFEETLPAAMKKTRTHFEILRDEGFEALNARLKKRKDKDIRAMVFESLTTTCKVTDAYIAYLVKCFN